LIITLAAVVTYSWYITRQIAGLRQLQTGLADRNRKDSLQLLRIQNDLNSVALAMRDMLDGGQPYPLTAWAAQFQRLRLDLDDALAREEQVAPESRTLDQRRYLASSFAQFWAAVDQMLTLARAGQDAEAGAGRPLGVFVASNDGVDTSRDTTASATTSFVADDLQNVKYALKPQYRANSATAWMFHRDGVKMAAKLKDGEGRYMLQLGLAVDVPDTLLGFPFMESEYSPSTFTTGLYVGMLADWSWYWIADALDMQVQRLVELYAETNQDGFIARYEGDGMPVLPEAFSRLKLA
jgi:predicted phage gp36 major capsid-like protein